MPPSAFASGRREAQAQPQPRRSQKPVGTSCVGSRIMRVGLETNLWHYLFRDGSAEWTATH